MSEKECKINILMPIEKYTKKYKVFRDLITNRKTYYYNIIYDLYIVLPISKRF